MIIINNIKINQCFIIHSLYKSNNKTKKIYDYIGFINSIKLLNNKIIIYENAKNTCDFSREMNWHDYFTKMIAF